MRIFALPAAGVVAIALWMSVGTPTEASAQSRPGPTPAIGEVYGVEFGAAWWNAEPVGLISSGRLGLIGSEVDFQSDLNFAATRFRDLRFVLRPSTRLKFRLQYTPIKYAADAVLERTINFSGFVFPVSVPVHSTFDWRVWRAGIEYDFVHRTRGFAGLLVEARHTRMSAGISTTGAGLLGPQSASIARTAVLPAIGFVARGYVVPRVALNFELGGLSLPKFSNVEKAHYSDLDVHGTVNLTNSFGIQAGWRKINTFLTVEQDNGDMTFQGPWFGAALRY